MLSRFITFILFVLSFAACKKEDHVCQCNLLSSNNRGVTREYEVEDCTVTKMYETFYHPRHGYPVYTRPLQLSYNSNNQLVRAEDTDSYFEYIYSGNRMAQFNINDSEEYHYSYSQGKLNRIDYYFFDMHVSYDSIITDTKGNAASIFRFTREDSLSVFTLLLEEHKTFDDNTNPLYGLPDLNANYQNFDINNVLSITRTVHHTLGSTTPYTIVREYKYEYNSRNFPIKTDITDYPGGETYTETYSYTCD